MVLYLPEELKSLVALDILSFNVIEFLVLKRSSIFTIFKDTGTLTMTSTLFGIH